MLWRKDVLFVFELKLHKAFYAECKLMFELEFELEFKLEFELKFELRFELEFELELEIDFEVELELLFVLEKEKSTLIKTQKCVTLSVINKLGLFELKFKWTIPVSLNDQFTQFLKLAKLYTWQIFKTKIGR